jgi:hypothetical protein
VVYATAPEFKSVGRLQAPGIRVDSVNLSDWGSVNKFMGRLHDQPLSDARFRSGREKGPSI